MRNHITSTWTDARTERLKLLYAQGMSCSQIAADLGLITRNGVIGKVHRLGLEKRGMPKAQQKPRARKQTAGGTVRKPIVPEPYICADVPNVEPLHIGVTELLPDDCRYPYGDGPFTFCGHPKLAASAYCREHAGLCAGASSPRRNIRPFFLPQKPLPKFMAGWT